jgi:hypothetical protein
MSTESPSAIVVPLGRFHSDFARTRRKNSGVESRPLVVEW